MPEFVKDKNGNAYGCVMAPPTDDQVMNTVLPFARATTEEIKKRNIRVWFIYDVEKAARIHGVDPEWFIDDSYIVGDEITIGLYSDVEKQVFSFFHELGHMDVTDEFKKSVDYNKTAIESKCWELGLLMALKYNVKLSPATIHWGYSKALTYREHLQPLPKPLEN